MRRSARLTGRATDLCARSLDLRARVTDLRARSIRLAARSTRLRARAIDLGSRSTRRGSRSTRRGARSTDLGSRATDLGARSFDSAPDPLVSAAEMMGLSLDPLDSAPEIGRFGGSMDRWATAAEIGCHPPPHPGGSRGGLPGGRAILAVPQLSKSSRLVGWILERAFRGLLVYGRIGGSVEAAAG